MWEKRAQVTKEYLFWLQPEDPQSVSVFMYNLTIHDYLKYKPKTNVEKMKRLSNPKWQEYSY